MTYRTSLLAASVLTAAAMLAPSNVQAQPVTGLYVAAGAGVNWHPDTRETVTIVDPVLGTGSGQMRVRSSIGFVGLGSVGWGFGNGLRLEVEGNYRSNDVRRVSVDGTSLAGRSGYITTMGLMVNALFDFNLGPVMPYIGGGVGYALHRWSNVGGTAGTPGNSIAIRITDTEGAFAYQGIVGLAIPIAAVPGLAITAEYRYFATLAAAMRGSSTSVTTGEGTTVSNGTARIKPDNQNHSLLIGVRYNFGRGSPMAPVAAVTQQARSFLVFFDFDRAELTPRAREILAQAAQASRTGTTRVEVAGHADRSGTPQYNQGLSQRRANNAAAELVRLGVPRNAISVAAFGESRPLVPTADGVREPQNRRVEIVLR